ncbi:hypothetical protein HYC85_005905 [Camellia sinensis]|uniref:Morc S5 domain-containing protein n=1 Tax=Camellia sinensis TaxID=4442 RepID=A0A7J7I0T8_CAMSI|nr:hypothetical protein HYC85_005905 [Camellia sinensis]
MIIIYMSKMNSADFVELSNDDKIGESSGTDSKKGLDSVLGTTELKENTKSKKVYRKSKTQSTRQKSEESRSSVVHSVSRNDSSVLDQGCSTVDESSPSSVPSFCPAPICQQFWKAGNYDTGQGYKTQLKNGKNHLRVHPMFLHSNATSHKWAFGAIAELLDNAVDEANSYLFLLELLCYIQNGATFVVIDKTTNPRDGNPALLIQDDGGGMDPKTIRRCMSFGFSDKKMKSAIGQYGNGFKTSSMRLGADVVVFTRHLRERTLTQSVGLLSYTFLRQTGHDRIVVPLVDYEFNESTTKLEPILSYGKEHFSSNLSVLLQWSPYLTEEIMLKQFDDIGNHGTKIVIYNLWLNDNGDMELDFDLDAEVPFILLLLLLSVGSFNLLVSNTMLQDIRVIADPKLLQTGCRPNQVSDQHIANLYHYSLRVYSSILYLRVPQSFKIVLRGRVVEHHNIANDLKFPEFILYKPHGGNMERSTSTLVFDFNPEIDFDFDFDPEITLVFDFDPRHRAVVTTIGFLKEAPRVNIHGFNVYYKNRLILPFWRVVKETTSSRGRGIVGVLEANFVEPTHNKQDFEKTSLFQKLEARLKEMTLEYWNFHCGLIGYQQMKKSPPAPKPSQETRSFRAHSFIEQPVLLNHRSSVTDNAGPLSSAVESFEDTVATPSKRKEQNPAGELEHVKRHTGSRSYSTDTQHIGVNQPTPEHENQLQDDEFTSLMQENEKLQTQLLELERSEECLTLKVRQLRKELGDIQSEWKWVQDKFYETWSRCCCVYLSLEREWSPYPTEEIMLKQFDDIGNHGTKIVIDNLWLNDNGAMELDFDLDAEDIRVIADPKLLQTGCCPNQVSDQHIANLYHYSLRAVVTTIGFLKEAPRVNIHGFNVYHKNRLILQMKKSPPAPKPSQETRSFRAHSFIEQPVLLNHRSSVTGNAGPLSSAVESFEVTVATPSKRKEQNPAGELEHVKRQTGSRSYSTDTQHIGVNQPTPEYENQLQDDEFTSLMQENEKLQTQQVQNRLLELERSEECLTLKVRQLRKELGDIQSEYARLVAESESMNIWSPYPTEEIMLKQFDDIGNHGTKIVIYNLWLNDNGDMELDFDLDAEDIRVIADPKLLQTGCRPNQAVVTAIGFLKEAPRGALEANFAEPTLNKQDFEKTSLFQKLEARLKEMTLEYWSSVTDNAGPLSSAVESFEDTVATPSKRKEQNPAGELEHVKRHPGSRSYSTDTQHIGVNQPTPEHENQLQDNKFTSLMQENEKLQTHNVKIRIMNHCNKYQHISINNTSNNNNQYSSINNTYITTWYQSRFRT